MYAILEHGGHQYRVTAGDRLLVDRIPAEIGSTVTLEPVLMVVAGGAAGVGAGGTGAVVTATVVAHRRGRKLRVFTYKPKKRRRRTLGYRSQLTELRVVEVVQTGGKGKAAAKPKPARTRAERPAAEAPGAEPVAVADDAAAADAEPAAAPPPAKRRAVPRRKAAESETGGGDGA